jgi:hypothetical protein
MTTNDTTTQCPVCEANRFEALRGCALRKDCIPLKVGYELEERAMQSEAEVARLKNMVMECAKKSDERSAFLIERVDKAEAIIKQLHHYAGILEGFSKPETNHD